jgi:hypothetical protein
MSILCSTKEISFTHNILQIVQQDFSVLDVLSIYNRHFLPFRRVDLNDRVGGRLLRCAPFVVDDHNFMGQRLASKATSTRE